MINPTRMALLVNVTALRSNTLSVKASDKTGAATDNTPIEIFIQIDNGGDDAGLINQVQKQLEEAGLNKKYIIKTSISYEIKTNKDTGLFELTDDYSVKPKYYLKVKATGNSMVTINLYDTEKDAFCFNDEDASANAAKKIIQYMKNPKISELNILNNDQQEALKKEKAASDIKYLNQALELFEKAPSQRENAYRYLLKNYLGRKELFDSIINVLSHSKDKDIQKYALLLFNAWPKDGYQDNNMILNLAKDRLDDQEISVVFMKKFTVFTQYKELMELLELDQTSEEYAIKKYALIKLFQESPNDYDAIDRIIRDREIAHTIPEDICCLGPYGLLALPVMLVIELNDDDARSNFFDFVSTLEDSTADPAMKSKLKETTDWHRLEAKKIFRH